MTKQEYEIGLEIGTKKICVSGEKEIRLKWTLVNSTTICRCSLNASEKVL